jgi:endonuclease YncB( thermonuclease family)
VNARGLLLALACCAPLACSGASFDAVVSHVTDGDTLWVRPVAGGPPQQLRIEGIDAPEICQAFGSKSREALAARVLRKRVTVHAKGADDYLRLVARVRFGREDVGRWLVANGYAWSYRFRGDRGPYARQEALARDRRLGLWAQSETEPPRSFRVRHGSCH